jgi:predicted enzyme related to lactoylglutathione lyase
MGHAVNWFTIPVKDLDRAKTFYESIFGFQMFVPEGPMKMAMFPADWQNGEIGGGISEGDGFEPSDAGSTVYLNGGPDLNDVLDNVEDAGGTVIMPKTRVPIGGGGHIALFLDSEGNRVGLHSAG